MERAPDDGGRQTTGQTQSGWGPSPNTSLFPRDRGRDGAWWVSPHGPFMVAAVTISADGLFLWQLSPRGPKDRGIRMLGP